MNNIIAVAFVAAVAATARAQQIMYTPLGVGGCRTENYIKYDFPMYTAFGGATPKPCYKLDTALTQCGDHCSSKTECFGFETYLNDCSTPQGSTTSCRLFLSKFDANCDFYQLCALKPIITKAKPFNNMTCYTSDTRNKNDENLKFNFIGKGFCASEYEATSPAETYQYPKHYISSSVDAIAVLHCQKACARIGNQCVGYAYNNGDARCYIYGNSLTEVDVKNNLKKVNSSDVELEKRDCVAPACTNNLQIQTFKPESGVGCYAKIPQLDPALTGRIVAVSAEDVAAASKNSDSDDGNNDALAIGLGTGGGVIFLCAFAGMYYYFVPKTKGLGQHGTACHHEPLLM